MEGQCIFIEVSTQLFDLSSTLLSLSPKHYSPQKTMKTHVAHSHAKGYPRHVLIGNQQQSVFNIYCSASVAANDSVVAISVELLSPRDPLTNETTSLPSGALVDEILSIGCDVRARRVDIVVVLDPISIHDVTGGA